MRESEREREKESICTVYEVKGRDLVTFLYRNVEQTKPVS